jgi:hypothetical protein
MVCGREKLNSVLDSAPQKSISLAKVFNNCKNAGLCNLQRGTAQVVTKPKSGCSFELVYNLYLSSTVQENWEMPVLV